MAGGVTVIVGQTASAQSQPLPTTLAGVRVEQLVFLANPPRTEWVPQRLLFVSPGQINFVTGFQPGSAVQVRVVRSNGTIVQRAVNINFDSAVGVFSANGSGQGPINGLLYPPGSASPSRATFTTVNGVIVNDPVPLTDGNGQPNRVVFFVTGLALNDTVFVEINDVEQVVEFAGPAPGFVGLQQINVALVPTTPIGNDVRVEVIPTAGTPTLNQVFTTISLTN